MKADVQYNDFIGTAAADISDFLGSKHGDYLSSIGKYYKIDEERFNVIGVELYGTDSFNISLLCVDKVKSTEEKEHIVSISIEIEDEKEILDILFKRLHIVLHSNFYEKYKELDYDEEIRFSDYHISDPE